MDVDAPDRQSRFAFPSPPASRVAFDAYHAANPHIWDAFVRFSLELKRSGRARGSISLVTERVRWWSSVEAKDDTFKINNTWRAFYARKLMEDVPALRGFFETRKSKADVTD